MPVLGVALALTVGSCVLAIVAAVLAATMHLSVTSAVSVAAGLMPLLLAPLARRTLGPRGPIFASVATIGAAGIVFLGAASALAEPILHDFRCGLGIMGFAFATPLFVAFCGTPIALVVWLIVGRGPRPRIDRVLRALPIPLLVVAAALVVLSAARRLSKPESAGYIATLPVVAELDRSAWSKVALSELPIVEHYSGPSFTYAERVEIPGGPSLLRACRTDDECHLFVRASSMAKAQSIASWQRTASSIVVRRDAAHDLFVLENVGPRTAVFGDGRARMPLYPRDVRGALAAPRDWIVSAALGVVAAIALLFRGRAREREAAAMRWREGFVTSDSTAVFADGTAIAIEHPLPEGTSVTARVRDETVTFRSAPSAGEVRAGTLEDRAAEARAEGTAGAATSVVVLALTIAPLVACVVHGVAF